jgi:hypothetical protein
LIPIGSLFSSADMFLLKDLKHSSIVAMGPCCISHGSGCLAWQSVLRPVSPKFDPEGK